MINKEVKEIFDKLNIPFYYMVAPKNNHNYYVIFSIIKEQDMGLYDCDNIKVEYYCSLNFWYRNPQDCALYLDIKKAFKQNKVQVRNVVDLPVSNGYYGKSFNLKITRLLNNEELGTDK